MRKAERLSQFVRDALGAGRSRGEIAAALQRAGWSDAEVGQALAAYAEGDFVPPVPRPGAYVSAHEAFLYALMFGALALSAYNLAWLLINLIDYRLPALDGTRGLYLVDEMRWSIAWLVVVFPLFLFLNGRVARGLKRDPGRRRSTVRKWFVYIALFLTASALLGDLVFVIDAFLSGEMTLRFALKALSVAAIAGIVFLYFAGEMREDADAR